MENTDGLIVREKKLFPVFLKILQPGVKACWLLSTMADTALSIKNGKGVVPVIYDFAGDFHNGYARGKKKRINGALLIKQEKLQ